MSRCARCGYVMKVDLANCANCGADHTDRDEMQTRAETAPKTRPNVDKLSNAIERAKRQDGHGLTPAEVLTLAIAAEKWHKRETRP